MIVRTYAKRFLSGESGAVTVEWVVLTAAIVGLGVAVTTALGSGTQSVTQAISDELAGTTDPTAFP